MSKYKMVKVEEQPYLYNEQSCSMDPSDISKAMGGSIQDCACPKTGWMRGPSPKFSGPGCSGTET